MRKLFQTIKRGPFEGWRGYFKSLWNDKEGMFWAVLLIAAWVLYGVYGCRAGDSTAPSEGRDSTVIYPTLGRVK